MRALNWERIGILRVPFAGLNVQYRVQPCSSPAGCGRLFDVYANYTREQSGSPIPLGDFWPHLFGPDPRDAGLIKPYRGESWMIWLVRRFDRLSLSPFVGATLIGLLFWTAWEDLTGLNLETSRYRVWAQRDVNNFIAIGEDGRVKTKGVFLTEKAA